MTEVYRVSHKEVNLRASLIAADLHMRHGRHGTVRLFGVPRGGIPVAYAVARHLALAEVVDDPSIAHAILDDIIDSGETVDRYRKSHPGVPFYALYNKRLQPSDAALGWLAFPWEGEDPAGGIEDNIRRLLQFIGEDPTREGLAETPARVAKAWRFWSKGYGEDPKEVLKCFEDGAEYYDEMILQRNIQFYTHCEHHMAPFFGVAHIAYIPGLKRRIVGLSKLARVLDIFARRLQVQERLTQQVADTLMKSALEPKGVAVSITATHFCMASRGVEKQGTITTTNALRGVFKDNDAARAEFLASIR